MLIQDYRKRPAERIFKKIKMRILTISICSQFCLIIFALVVIPSVSIADVPPDQYENDDEYYWASYIEENSSDECENSQFHSLHNQYDVDWISFTINDSDSAEVKIFDVWGCAIWVELYSSEDLYNPLFVYYGDIIENISIFFEEFTPGDYYVKIQLTPWLYLFDTQSYSFCVIESGIGPTPAFVEGFVKDSISGSPIIGATVNSSFGINVISGENGYYLFIHKAGIFTFTASTDGYIQKSSQNVFVPEGDVITLNFDLIPVVGLNDTIAALQVMSGKTDIIVPSQIDINQDGKIGLEETIIYLQILTEIRR